MAVKKDAELMNEEKELDDIRDSDDGAEEQKAELKEYQGPILDALLAAAEYESDKEECYRINIVRPKNGENVILFSFRIHPLSEEKMNACRKKNTKSKRDRRYGIDREKVDGVRYRSQIIYEATMDEDRERIWNNRDVWEKLNVLNGIDLIDKVLKGGEKDKVVESIENISGYGNDEDLELLVKN